MADQNKKLELTLTEYIKNPSGKGSSVIGRDLIKLAYTDGYNKLMVKYNSTMKHFFAKDKEDYYCLIKVPSGSITNFFYEVVFKFSPRGGSDAHATNLKDYKVTFFANDPAFMFTYAYAYNNAGLLIEEIKSKLGEEPLNVKSKERNPQEIINYAKILYYGYLYFNQHGFINKSYYEGSNFVITKEQLFDMVMDADTKLAARQEEESKIDKSDALYKAQRTHTGARASHATGNTKQTMKVKNTRRTRNVKTTRMTKRK